MVEKPGTTASLNLIRGVQSSRLPPIINKPRRRGSRCCRSPTWARANSLSTRFRCFRAAIRIVPAGDGATPTACAGPSRVR